MDKFLIIFRNITVFGIGDSRSNLTKKNIIGAFFIKGANIFIGLLLIPIIVNYLEPTRYGIWITLSSIIGWFGFFDIGLGNGLRNRLAEAFAAGDNELARIYVSTTYVLLSIIITVVLTVFYTSNLYLNWNIILNAETEVISNSELSLLVCSVFTFFSIQFVLKLINTILTADQLSAKSSLFDLFAKVLSLFFIYVLISTTHGSLLYLGIALSISPIIVLIISSLWFFNRDYKWLKPGLKFVKFDKVKDLLSLGVKFFIIQLSVIFLYQANTIIIAQLLGPEKVASYSITFQYFSVITMLFSIVLTPFWSAITEAWSKNDILWIKNVISKLCSLWIVLILVGLLMLVLSKSFFNFWIGADITIPFTMSVLIVIWVLMNAWNSIFSQFINGVGKLNIQLYLGTLSALLNVPLAIFLGMKYGVYGILISNIIVVLPGTLIYPIQYLKIINNSSKGIWNR